MELEVQERGESRPEASSGRDEFNHEEEAKGESQ